MVKFMENEMKESENNKQQITDLQENEESISSKSAESGKSTKENKEAAVTKKSNMESSQNQKIGTSEHNDNAKGPKKVWIPVCVAIVIVTICAVLYVGIALTYREKFLPDTWVNNLDCSDLDGTQVSALLENQLQSYNIVVTGRDPRTKEAGAVIGQLTASDLEMTYSDVRSAVDGLLKEQNIWTWPVRKLSKDIYGLQLQQGVLYDKENLQNMVENWEACLPDHMIAPQDAYISDYSRQLKGYEIVPETEGTEFEVGQLLELLNAAIVSQETSVDLEAEGCYKEPAVRQDDPRLAEAVEKANKWLGTKITYDWNGAEVVVDAELLHDWITMEKSGPVLDEESVTAFVREQAEANDTYGKRRNFMTTLGVELSLSGAHYGWLTDRDAEAKKLIELIYQGSNVSREPIYASTAKQKGVSDIGDSYVEADLTHQHLYLYEDGAIIFETDFVSGSMSSTPDCITPEGVFGVTYKTTNAVLRGATYETPVNYWMPFYGNYGMHDATWRGEFGGQIYIQDGSHGCINLPLSAAALIYEHVSTGFPVICYYYQADPLAEQNAQPEENNDWEDSNDWDEGGDWEENND